LEGWQKTEDRRKKTEERRQRVGRLEGWRVGGVAKKPERRMNNQRN